MNNILKSYGLIYKIVCKTNGKLYIGQTIRSISQRWNGHVGNSKKRRNKDKLKISRAMAKYGIENFQISVICYANTQKELNDRERTAIRLFDSIKSGYNVHEGGLNQRMSEFTKAKISAANKGKKRSKESRERYRSARLGTVQPEHVKIKCSESQLGEKSSWWSRKHTEEVKVKIGAKHKGKIVSELSKEKMRQSKLGTKASDETKEKMSIKRKGRKPNQKSVLCITNGCEYVSIKIAAERLRISINSLHHHLKGKLRSAQGFQFKYV